MLFCLLSFRPHVPVAPLQKPLSVLQDTGNSSGKHAIVVGLLLLATTPAPERITACTSPSSDRSMKRPIESRPPDPKGLPALAVLSFWLSSEADAATGTRYPPTSPQLSPASDRRDLFLTVAQSEPWSGLPSSSPTSS